MDEAHISSREEHDKASVKRALVACTRCRQLKVRCTGQRPCDPCKSKGRICKFDDRMQKVTVTKGYVQDLEKRVAFLERKESEVGSNSHGEASVLVDLGDEQGETIPSNSARQQNQDQEGNNNQPKPDDNPAIPSPSTSQHHQSRQSSVPQLWNPLGLSFPNYYINRSGYPLYFGTSSNWSFGRRILSMAYERINGLPLPRDDLHFESEVYDLGWDGKRTSLALLGSETSTLPAKDFALHLIKVVDFHCGHLFYLFDEELFMHQFALFHEQSPMGPTRSSLWYVHYLLILAFGKAYVVQSSPNSKAAGTDHFVQALQLLPDFMFFGAEPIELIQVLCCAALFFHCLDFRCAAYNTIGWAVRLALEHGLHTDMQSQEIDACRMRRCRKLWWTVYVLDRQMATLLGVPGGIADEFIATLLPDFPGDSRMLLALEAQIKLSKHLGHVLNIVYGPEDSSKRNFLSTAKETLKSIAALKSQLDTSFSLSNKSGISRLSAHLHLLYHRCIILTTRPVLYSILEAKLDISNTDFAQRFQASYTRTLLNLCVDSAQHMLTTLNVLYDQALLESFLPFDLDATFMSVHVILMANAIDMTLVDNRSPWTSKAYTILDDMTRRGNLIARMTKAELQKLEATLQQLPIIRDVQEGLVPDSSRLHDLNHQENVTSSIRPSSVEGRTPPPLYEVERARSGNLPALPQSPIFDNNVDNLMGSWWPTSGPTAEQLMDLADSIELDGLEWLWAPIPEV